MLQSSFDVEYSGSMTGSQVVGTFSKAQLFGVKSRKVVEQTNGGTHARSISSITKPN